MESDLIEDPFGFDCVVATLKKEIGGIFDSQSFSEVCRFTRIWLQRNNRWQFAVGHVSQLVLPYPIF